MERFDTIKTTIDANIKENGNQEITGQKMNSILTEMVNATDAGLTELESEIGKVTWNQGSIDADGSFRPVYASRVYSSILSAPVSVRTNDRYLIPFYVKYDLNLNFVERVDLLESEVTINEGYIRLVVETSAGTPMSVEDDFIEQLSSNSLKNHLDTLENDLEQSLEELKSDNEKLIQFYLQSYPNLFNRFDENFVDNGYVNWTNGEVAVSESYETSGYISIEGGKEYTISPIGHYAWYDKDMVFISGEEATTFGTIVLLAPQDAMFIRVSIDKRKVYSHDLYVHEGNAIQIPYRRYGEYNETNDIAMPSKEYFLKGFQNDIFVEPIIKRYIPYEYDVRFSGNINFLKRLKRVSAANPSVNAQLTTQLIDRTGFAIKKTIVSDVIVGDILVGDSDIKVSIIGDSFTQGGNFDGFFKKALLDNGYVPNIKMIGTRRIKDYQSQYMEGRGGWKMSTYFSYIPDSMFFFNPFMQPQGTPCFWGTKEFWKKAWEVKKGIDTTWNSVYRCGGYDDFLDKFDENTGALNAPVEGDMMYDYANSQLQVYSGGQWFDVTFDDYVWEFSYRKYLSMWGLATPDILCEMLGLNDFYQTIDSDCENIDFTPFVTNLDKMISSFFDANPSGKFAVLLPCSSCGSMDNIDGEYTDKTDAAMWNLRKVLIDRYDNRENEHIYIVDVALSIDKENGFTLQPTSSSLTNPFAEYEGSLKLNIQTNVPHPTISYPTMGRTLAAFIQSNR